MRNQEPLREKELGQNQEPLREKELGQNQEPLREKKLGQNQAPLKEAIARCRISNLQEKLLLGAESGTFKRSYCSVQNQETFIEAISLGRIMNP